MMGLGEVDEADAGRVHEGQSVTLRLDAHPDIRYHARIENGGDDGAAVSARRAIR